jgi:hypothetical protein
MLLIVLGIVLGSSLGYNMPISVLIAKVFRERRSLAFGMGQEFPGNKSVLDEMKQLRDLGVYVGTYCQPMIPSLYQPVADPMETIRTIKEIGPDRCIIGSDFSQVLHMDAIDGMRVFIRALLGFGIKPDEVKVMLQDNPAKLMWLD